MESQVNAWGSKFKTVLMFIMHAAYPDVYLTHGAPNVNYSTVYLTHGGRAVRGKYYLRCSYYRSGPVQLNSSNNFSNVYFNAW